MRNVTFLFAIAFFLFTLEAAACPKGAKCFNTKCTKQFVAYKNVRIAYRKAPKGNRKKCAEVYNKLIRVDLSCFSKNHRGEIIHMIGWTANQIGKSWVKTCQAGGIIDRKIVDCVTEKKSRWQYGATWLHTANHNGMQALKLRLASSAPTHRINATLKLINDTKFWIKAILKKKRCMSLEWCRHLKNNSRCEKQYNHACSGNL